MVTSHTSDTMIQAMAGIQQPQQQSINVREGLAMLVVGVIENSKILQILNNPKSTGKRFFCYSVIRTSRLKPNDAFQPIVMQYRLRTARDTEQLCSVIVLLHLIPIQ
jgi:hypothetical protein